MRRRTLIASLTAIFLAAGGLQASAQDRVDLRHGRPVVGKVLSEDYRKVTLKVRKGGERSVPCDQILDIVRAGAPDTYRNGRIALQKGDLPNARKLLQNAVDQADKPWVKEYATFYLAETQRAAGQYDKGIRAYKAVLTANKKSRFLHGVRLGIARCLSSDGKIGPAVKELDGHVKEVDTLTLPVAYKLSAQMMLGRLLGSQGKHAESASAFEAVIRAAENLLAKAKTPEDKGALRLVLLGGKRDLGAACIKAKQLSKAASTYSAIASSYKDDPVAQAIAAIGKAEVTLGQGNADLARVQLTEVLAVHFSARGELPRAIWLLAEAYGKLAEQGEKGADQRRRNHLKDLVEHYPGSDQAAEARKALNLK